MILISYKSLLVSKHIIFKIKRSFFETSDGFPAYPWAHTEFSMLLIYRQLNCFTGSFPLCRLLLLVLLSAIAQYASAGNSNPQLTVISGNPGFENNSTGWSYSSAPPFSINSTASYIRSGTKSLRISTTSTTDLKASNTGGTVTAPSSGYVTVMAYLKGENNLLRAKMGVYNTGTSTESSAGSYTTSSTGGFTRISASFSCNAGESFYPMIFCNSSSGATATGEIDDVVIYFSSSSTLDATNPSGAPTSIQGSASGTSITLSWTAGSDAESGVEGYMVVRLSGLVTTSITPLSQTNYSTTSTDGPTTAGSGTVVYNGNALTFTDNPGATGSYTYILYTRDKAYNYTAAASSARMLVVNGTSVSGTISGTISVDGLYIAPTCSVTVGSVLTIKTGANININGTIIDNGGITNNGSVTFLNGSTYIFDRNSVTQPILNATWNTGSTAKISGIRNFVPTGFNQTFYNVEWDCPTQNRDITLDPSFNVMGTLTVVNTDNRSITLGSNNISGSILQSGGTLNFTASTTINLNGSSRQVLKVSGALASVTVNNSSGVALGGNTTISETLTLQSGAVTDSSYTLTMASGSTIARSAGSLSEVPVFSGTVNLQYTGNLTTGNEVPSGGAQNVTVNASTGITLASVLRVNGTLTFTSGIISSNVSNYLHFAAGSSFTGASATTHVNGPVRKTGNTAFTFPVGDGSNYLPLSISAPSAATDAYTAQYLWASPLTFGTSLGSGLSLVSSQEYYSLNRNAGTSNVSATLSWNSRSLVSNLSDLRVALWNGSQWTSQGNASTSGNSTSGTITSNTLGGYGTIAFGTATMGQNWLPVSLLNFQANCYHDYVELTWNTASEKDNDYFSVERSRDAKIFEPMAQIKGINSSTGSHYEYNIQQTENETWYYRLSQTDFNGDSEYLKTIIADCGKKKISLQLRNNAQPTLEATVPVAGNYIIQITEITGKKLFNSNLQLIEGANNISLDKLPLNNLMVCTLTDSEGHTTPLKFLLQ